MIPVTRPTTPPDWFAANAPTPSAPSTPATPAPTTGQPAAGSNTDPNAFRDAWFASPYPKNTEGLKQFVAANPQFGATIFGSKGSKVKIGGMEFQAVRSAGVNGGIGPAWDDLSQSPQGSGTPLGGDFGSFAHGFEEKFHAPSIEEIRGMPGYQFALDEGVNALDKRAAAMGTVNNGGQKKDILTFATGLADQTAQTKYQNALGEYMNSYNIFRNNQNDVFGRFDTLAQRGTNAANAATS